MFNKSVARAVRDPSLAEELPFWEFNQLPFPHLLLADGSVSAGLSVSQVDVECLDSDQVNALAEALRSMMNSLPEGLRMQWSLSVDSDFEEMIASHERSGHAAGLGILADIERIRSAKLRDQMAVGGLYRPHLRVYLKLRPTETKVPSLFAARSKFVSLSQEQYDACLSDLRESLESLTGAFESLGISCYALSRQEMMASIYQWLNPSRSRSEPHPSVECPSSPQLDSSVLAESPWLAASSPRSELVFGDLLLNLERFTLDSTDHAVITLKTLPEVTYAAMISTLLRLPFHYDLVLTVDVPPQAKEMRTLQARRRMAHSMSLSAGGRAADLENETKLGATEELIRELLSTGQKVFAAELVVILRTPHGPEGSKELSRRIREVLARVRTLNGAEAMAETVAAWKVFKSTLPGAPVDLLRAKRMKTNNLVDFLPLYGPRIGDPNPKVLLFNRLGGLVGFDPFSPELPNYNALVTGASGSGKSFLNNCILMQELARGGRAFVIDIGGSYRKLTEALGGQYIEINLSQAQSINPFHLADPAAEPSSQKIKSLLAIVELMTAEDDTSRLPRLDRVLLEKALVETYAQSRRAGVIPSLSDLAENCNRSEEPVLRTIGKMLYSWTGDRPYGKLLDRPGSLNASGQICAFDLKGLSSWPDLQCVMILIITEFILGEVERDKSTNKRIILDEAWELLKAPASARFMEYCARTLRKSGSGITFITQGVEEIVASPIGAAILGNTATKFVLLQRGNTAALQAALHLNPQELALVESLSQRKGVFSEALLIEGAERQLVRIQPEPLEYWLSTSDAKDNAYLDSLIGGGQCALIDALRQASRDYPYGVARSGKEGG